MRRRLYRRVQFQDLRPGDTFEYRYKPRRGRLQTRRDTVLKHGVPTGKSKGIWRGDLAVKFVDGREENSHITLYTATGQDGHGYVTMRPDIAVVLLERDDTEADHGV